MHVIYNSNLQNSQLHFVMTALFLCVCVEYFCGIFLFEITAAERWKSSAHTNKHAVFWTLREKLQFSRSGSDHISSVWTSINLRSFDQATTSNNTTKSVSLEGVSLLSFFVCDEGKQNTSPTSETKDSSLSSTKHDPRNNCRVNSDEGRQRFRDRGGPLIVTFPSFKSGLDRWKTGRGWRGQ